MTQRQAKVVPEPFAFRVFVFTLLVEAAIIAFSAAAAWLWRM